jgi:hypothetical protein
MQEAFGAASHEAVRIVSRGLYSREALARWRPARKMPPTSPPFSELEMVSQSTRGVSMALDAARSTS